MRTHSSRKKYALTVVDGSELLQMHRATILHSSCGPMQTVFDRFLLIRPTRVAERAPAYSADSRGATGQARAWPAADELRSIQGKIDQAIQAIEVGRHVTGERALRRGIGNLTRRHDWRNASRGMIALSGALLKRGRLAAAEGAIDLACQYAARAGRDSPIGDLTVAGGRVLFARGLVQQAERVFSSALVASGESCNALSAVRVELARCLFWQGRYREADRVLDALAPNVEARAAIYAEALRAGIAAGRRDFGAAVARALGATQQATVRNDQTVLAAAASSAALVHLCVGDHAAVDRDVTAATKAARSTHHPLIALGAELISAESARRRHRAAPAVALLSRINSMSHVTLPHVLRARCSLLSDLVTGAAPAREVVARRVASTGLGGLALFAPLTTSAEDCVMREGVNDVLEILNLCQQANDDGAVLRDLCRYLRQQLGASVVTFFVRRGETADRLAGDGGRPGSGLTMAQRVMSTAQFVPPYRVPDGTEGGAPVRYGGETSGALVARWTIGANVDLSRIATMLTTAATAAAPMVVTLGSRRATQVSPDEFIGISAATADLRRAVERAAGAPFAVLVTGESGSGKEVVARALHRRGPRRDRPFGTLNCAALPEDLVESELFGHARGAFTGAIGERPGVFEDAHTGTLFLDEVGELSPRAQAKVLRTLQDSELRRVGENVTRRVDVRIISATNRNLADEVATGRFRLDLLYRLDVLRITVTPLRDRREDIPLMAEHFWRDATARIASRATLAMETVAALSAYSWPGNVRELQNVLAALAVRSPRRGVVSPAALPPHFARDPDCRNLRLDAARRTFEERFVRAALVRTGGHRTRAAAELGLSRQGLNKLIVRLGIIDRLVTP